jgi:hypothetical protein
MLKLWPIEAAGSCNGIYQMEYVLDYDLLYSLSLVFSSTAAL